MLGGYGLFGSRIVQGLAKDCGLHLVVAGRDRDKAGALLASLPQALATTEAAALDTESPDFSERLAAHRPDLVIDTAGPFQGRDYRVARAALAAGAHCIDLADGRGYVMGIGSLDEEARKAGRWVISGASSVPALHAAVIAAHLDRFAVLESVQTAISPGNRTPRGWATTQAILGYVGKPIRMLLDGQWRTTHGWQSLRRLHIEGVGTRWLAHCEVPDLDVLPARYPQLRTLEFRAGLELRRMHLGLWLGSFAVRTGLIRNLAHWARPLHALSERWQHIGSDVGCMRVGMRGTSHEGRPLAIDWTLVARGGNGPDIPASPAVLLARKLARGVLPGAGARPCLDLFTLDEVMGVLDPVSIGASTREHA